MTTLQNMRYIMNKIAPKSNYGAPFFKNLSLIELDNYKTLTTLNINPNCEILFKMPVSEEFCNALNTMHGGAISTLIDITTTIAISGFDNTLRHNVSVELSTYYLNPIKINSNLLVHVKVPKIGKSLAYSHADIYAEENLKMCANGSHVKAMLDKTWNI